MTFSGDKKTHAEVLLGGSTSSTSGLRIAHLASTTGRTEVFVSGGEQNSHQGPPDGNPLALIVRTDP